MKGRLAVRNIVYDLLDSPLGSFITYQLYKRLYQVPDLVRNRRVIRRHHKRILTGLLNQRYLPNRLNDLWPAWVSRQLSPASSEHVIGNGLILFNTTCRNVTLLGTPKTTVRASVDPAGIVSPAENSWSLDYFLREDTRVFCRSNAQGIRQTADSPSPKVVTDRVEHDIRTTQSTLFSVDSIHGPIVLTETVIQNLDSVDRQISFNLAIRPINSFGISPIYSTAYLSSGAVIVNDQIGLILDKRPDNILCLTHRDGSMLDTLKHSQMILMGQCERGLGNAVIEYRLTLKPGETAFFSYKLLPPNRKSRLLSAFQNTLLPQQRTRLMKQVASLQELNFASESAKADQSWTDTLDSLASISFSDPPLSELFDFHKRHLCQAATVSQFISNSVIQPGYFVALALHQIGASAMVKPLVSTLLEYRVKDLFSSNELRPIQISAALMVIRDYVDYSGDRSVLDKVGQLISSSISIVHPHLAETGFRRRDAQIESHFGEAFEYDPDTHYFVSRYWCIAGQMAAEDLCRLAGRHGTANRISRWVTETMRNLHHNIRVTTRSTDPFIPTRRDGAIDHNIGLSALAFYPFRLFPIDGALGQKTLSNIRHFFTENTQLYYHQGLSGIHTPLNLLLAYADLDNRNTELFDRLDQYKRLATSTLCWPETLNLDTYDGISGAGDSLLASALFISLIREMCISESKGTLKVTPFISRDMAPNDTEISLKSVPTRYGEFSISFSREHTGQLNVDMDCSKLQGHRQIQLCFRDEVKLLRLDGNEISIHHTSVWVPSNANSIVLIF